MINIADCNRNGKSWTRFTGSSREGPLIGRVANFV